MKRSSVSGNESFTDLEEIEDVTIVESPKKKMKTASGAPSAKSCDRVLLDLAFAQVNKCDSSSGACRKSYSTQIKKLDFLEIAKTVGMEPLDCLERLKKLLTNTVKMKCLSQLIGEALHMMPVRQQYQSTFLRFMKENSEWISDEQSKLGVDKVTAASSLWEKLKPKQRKKYENEDDDMQEVDDKTPFEVYYKSLRKKISDVSIIEARARYSKLKEKRKLKYIERSAKIFQELMSKEDSLNDTTRPIRDSPKIKGPSKEDVAMLLRSQNVPEMPQKTHYLYYFYEAGLNNGMDVTPNVLFVSRKAFSNLSEKKQARWQKKYEAVWAKYEDEVVNWKKQQSDTISFLYDYSRKKKTAKVKKSITEEINDLLMGLQYMEMPVHPNMKFSGEPSLPPMTAQQLFADINGLHGQDNTDQFNALDKNGKQLWAEKSLNTKSKYKEDLLQFIGSMTSQQKNLYLGVRRVKFIKLFKTDIFEALYPNHLFPAYVKNKQEAMKFKFPKPPIKKSSSTKETVVLSPKARTVSLSSEDPDPKTYFGSPSPKAQSSKSLVNNHSSKESDSDSGDDLTAWTNSALSKKKDSSSSEEESS